MLEIQNIRSSIEHYDNDEKLFYNIETSGGIQKILFLTEFGLYKLLMQSRKPIAKLFQKWVCKIIVNIRETGKYNLEEKFKELQKESNNNFELALKLEAENCKKIIELNNHNALIDAFKNKYVVYFGKIKEFDDGKILIKIGSSKQIENRIHSLTKDYNNFMLIKVFEVLRNEAFEKFLHKHPNIIKFKYNDDIIHSNEIFLVSNEEYKKIIDVAVHNKFKFNNIIENDQVKEIENIKLKQLEEIYKINELVNENQKISTDTYIDPIILLHDNRKHTQARGEKIQRYSDDGLTLIKTYECFADALRDKELSSSDSTSRSSIKKAIDNNIIYKNFRWAELKRNLPDDTIQILEKTIKSKTVKIGYVSMLNLNKDKIINVFCDMKAACEDRKFSSCGSISNSIKRNSKSSGHYFLMFDDCDETLKEEWLKNNKLPQKRFSVNKNIIEQLHPITNKCLKIYSSMEDIIKEFKIARKTIKSACEFDLICKGYKWKIVNN